MYVIRDIDWIRVDSDYYQMLDMPPMSGLIVSDKDGERHLSHEQVMEMIKGRKYRRPDGSTIILGNSSIVNEMIGTQLEEVDYLMRAKETAEAERKKAETKTRKLNDRVAQLSKMSFLNRAKFLLNAKLPEATT